MAEFFSKEIIVEGEEVRVQFWDTAGQELFRSITAAFYKGCSAVILCYDITSRKSFANLDHWIKEIRNNCEENIPVILVGNKADLEERRSVRTDEALLNAKAREFYFMEVSALTNDDLCVNKAFEVILRQALVSVKRSGEKETYSEFRKSIKMKTKYRDPESSDEEFYKQNRKSKKSDCC
jgi:small GTP-binding protein